MRKRDAKKLRVGKEVLLPSFFPRDGWTVAARYNRFDPDIGPGAYPMFKVVHDNADMETQIVTYKLLQFKEQYDKRSPISNKNVQRGRGEGDG